MIQLTIVRTKEGGWHCGRHFEVIDMDDRDKNYGFVNLPPFECEMLQGVFRQEAATPAEMEMLRNLAAPLFPELHDDRNEGEEWKDA